MPASAKRGLLFLTSLFDTGLGPGTAVGEFGRLVEALSPVVSTWLDPAFSSSYTGIDWERNHLGTWRADTPPGNAELAFLGRFESLEDERRPLAGIEAPADGGCRKAGG